MKSIKKFTIGVVAMLTILTASMGFAACDALSGMIPPSGSATDSTTSESSAIESSESSPEDSSQAPHVHTWGEWEVLTQPTCTDMGQQQRVCLENEEHIEVSKIAPLKHAWGSWEITTPPTCTEAGVQTRVCEHDSSHTETKAADPLDHAWGDWEITTPPTCTEAGVQTRVCEHDNTHTETKAADPLDHAWGDWEVTTPPTCTEAGEQTRVCGRDSTHTETKTVNPLDHAWGDWEVTTPPTCTTAGEQTRVCGRDSTHTETETVNPLDHAWGDWEVTTPPTCTTAGVQTRVCERDSAHVETQPKADSNAHAWGEWETTQEPTCAAEGISTRVCTLNANHTETKPIDKLTTHDWNEWETTQEPTCIAEGVSTRVCKVDASHIETQPIEKTNVHNEGADGACTVCGKQLHAVDVTVDEAPTSVKKIYYGEQATLTGGRVSFNGVAISGTWSIDSSTLSGFGNTADITTTGIATFTPSDLTKYNPVTAEVDVVMYAVATYNNVYFSLLDDALNAANEANTGTVYALSSNSSTETSKTVKAKTLTVTEIKSGVTLALPYADTTILSHEFDVEEVLAFDKPSYLTNQVTLGKDVTLTVNGSLQIGAIISGKAVGQGNLASYPCKQYAQLTLDDGAKIINNKTMECYGYLTEKTSGASNGVENFGSLTTPFTILEFHGGSAYFAISGVSKFSLGLSAALGREVKAEPEVTPFNRFYFPSITALLTVRDSGTLNGYVNLYANSNHNTSTVTIVGSTTSALIQLKTGAWLTADLDEKTDITKLDIYGNAAMNPMSLSIKATASGMTVTVSLSTKKAMFPISWLYQVGLHPAEGEATVTLTQSLKIMPGGSLTIDEGVRVTGSKLIVYNNDMSANRSTNSDVTYRTPNYNTTYPHNGKTIPAGELIVNGTLELDALAGVVKTTSTTGKLTVKSTTSITVKELDYYTGTTTDSKAAYYNISETFTLDLYQDSDTPTRVENATAGTYQANGNGWVKAS